MDIPFIIMNTITPQEYEFITYWIDIYDHQIRDHKYIDKQYYINLYKENNTLYDSYTIYFKVDLNKKNIHKVCMNVFRNIYRTWLFKIIK